MKKIKEINMITKFKDYLKESDSNLRAVEVEYENGDKIRTSMAGHLTDEEIYDYFKPGKVFNIGSVEDNLQKVKSVKILEKINEGKMDNPVSPDFEYDPERQWFIVNIEEGEIVSAWDLLEDAFKDGLVDNLLVGQGILNDEQAWDFKDKIDDFLGVFDEESLETSEIDGFLENMGVKIFTIRHRSEL